MNEIPPGKTRIGVTVDGQVQLANADDALAVVLTPDQLIDLGLACIETAGAILKAQRLETEQLEPAGMSQQPSVFRLEVVGNA